MEYNIFAQLGSNWKFWNKVQQMIKANLITHNKNIIYNYKLKLMSENCTYDFSSTHILCVCGEF